MGVDPITSTGLVDCNAKADFSGTATSANYGNYKKADGTYYAQNNQAGNGFAYITVANSEDKDGKITDQKLGYWMNPGSNYRENVRGMVFSASLNATTGVMEGCANSGSASVDMASGISIRRMVKEIDTDANISLTPRGMYHPFANLDDLQGNSAQVTSNGTGDFKHTKTSPTLAIKWAALQSTGGDGPRRTSSLQLVRLRGFRFLLDYFRIVSRMPKSRRSTPRRASDYLHPAGHHYEIDPLSLRTCFDDGSSQRR